MAEVFKKIKESHDKEAGQMFVAKILPLYAQFPNIAIRMNLSFYVDSPQSSMTGLLRLSQSPQPGSQAGWRMDGQLQSCQWSDSS
jgi:hypothetical protein